MSDKINIRSSSLASFANCPRHYAFRCNTDYAIKVFEDHPDLTESVKEFAPFSAPLGTAFHAVLETGATDHKSIFNLVDNTFQGLNTKEPGFFGEKYGGLDDVKHVVTAMVEVAIRSPLLKEWTTERDKSTYEEAITSDRFEGIEFSGHIDCISKDKVIDLKTSTYVTPANLYELQLTAYRMLAEEAGHSVGSKADLVKVSRPNTPRFRTPPSVARYTIETKSHEKRVKDIIPRVAELKHKVISIKPAITSIPNDPTCQACMYCDLRNTSACPETQYLKHE